MFETFYRKLWDLGVVPVVIVDDVKEGFMNGFESNDRSA